MVKINQLKDRLAEWNVKQDPSTLLSKKIHFKYKDISRMKIKGWEDIYHINIYTNIVEEEY